MSRAYQILRQVRAAGRQARRDHARETMQLELVETAMRKIIRERLITGEPIALDDFRLANLPMAQVEANAKRLIKSVMVQLAMERS